MYVILCGSLFKTFIHTSCIVEVLGIRRKNLIILVTMETRIEGEVIFAYTYPFFLLFDVQELDLILE